MTSLFESRSRTAWLICLAGMALVALNAFRAAPQIAELFIGADGDDQMRLVQVRDWLAGQGWFDLRQYRVLPPEGISMHWSRYIDVGIAAVMTAAAWVFPHAQAELAAVILWPSLLACLMVLILAHGTSRIFGSAAALGALAVFLSWGKLGGEFVAPRIDHHNVQILCTTAVFYLALVPGRARLLGALAGMGTALSLAIGLEMLPPLATIWGMMALRHAFDEPETGPWLICFGAAFSLAAPLLMIGQTAQSDWASLHCDVLAPPVMALGAVGVVSTLTSVLAGRWLKSPLHRILLLVALSALGLWLAYPVLGHCLAGPYSAVTPEVRQIIALNVIEARSAAVLLSENPKLLGQVLGPPLVIGVMALVAIWLMRRRIDRRQAIALGQAFLVFAAGLAIALTQIRAANLMTPALPMLGGFLLHAFTHIPRSSVLRAPAMIALVLALPTLVERAAAWLVRPAAVTAPAGQAVGVAGTDCRSTDAMAEIASLPRSVLLTTLNLGPTILTYTPHSVASAAYHRSPDAFWNGVGSFTSEAALKEALTRSGADYVVLCRGGALEATSPYLSTLLGVSLPPWLAEATEGRRSVRVFRVVKSTLAIGGSAP